MSLIINHKLSDTALHILSNIEKFQGQWEGFYIAKEPALIDSLTQTSVITSSGASTRIEGAILTDSQVAELIEKGCKISKMSSRSEREVAGYVNCLHYIYENYRILNISEHSIRELHQLMTSELLEDQLPKKQRGRYKDVPNHVIEKNLSTGEETIWFETTPPGPQTETAMHDLLSNYDEKIREIEVSKLILNAAFIVRFLAIHPFRDGNGRLSRLLTTLLMLKSGYTWCQFVSHEKVIEDNKERYYLSLRQTQSSFLTEKTDYNPWLEFFFTVLQKQTEIIKVELKKQEPVSELGKNEIKVYQIVSQNGPTGISYLETNVEMTRSGLKTLLARLVRKGFLLTIGRGKGTKYKLAS
jgi:Fic family protein